MAIELELTQLCRIVRELRARNYEAKGWPMAEQCFICEASMRGVSVEIVSVCSVHLDLIENMTLIEQQSY